MDSTVLSLFEDNVDNVDDVAKVEDGYFIFKSLLIGPLTNGKEVGKK